MDFAILKEFNKLLRKKDFKGIENYFLNLLTSFPQPNLIIELVNQLEKQGFFEEAVFFLSLAKEHFWESNQKEAVWEVIKKLASFKPLDLHLRREVINLALEIFKSKDLDTYLYKSHLTTDGALPEAISTLENFIKFEPGNYLLTDLKETVLVIGYDFLFDKIELKSKEGTVKKVLIDYAFKHFISLSADHFLVRKHFFFDELKKEAEKNLAGVLEILLKSFKEGLKFQEIKEYLSDLAPIDEIKKSLEKETHIKISNRGKEKIYQWSDEVLERRLKAKTEKTKVKNDFSSFLNLSLEEVKRGIIEAKTYYRQRELLAFVKEKREDWEEIYKALFFELKSHRILDFIYQHLSDENKEFCLTEVFVGYRSFLEQFLYLIEKHTEKFPSTALFLRLFDLLSFEPARKNWRAIREFLFVNRQDFVKKALAELSEVDKEQILTALASSKGLKNFEVDEIKKLIEKEGAKKEKGVIYHTHRGIKKLEEELRRLVEVELKRNAMDLAKARSFGDLSENYEYKIAKEERVRLLNRIRKLEEELKNSVPIDFNKVKTDRVMIGTRIKIENLKSGVYEEYAILGPYDACLEKKIISYLSPFAQGFIGKSVGDRVRTEDGEEYQILAIESARAFLEGEKE